MTTQPEAKNLSLIAHHDLNGFGNGGEGIALQAASDGRRVLYIAHESAPKDFTAVDVTDPNEPRVIVQTELPHGDVRSNSLALVDDLLLVAYQTSRPGLSPAGLGLYDVSNPDQPREVGSFDTSGPYSRGAHYVWVCRWQVRPRQYRRVRLQAHAPERRPVLHDRGRGGSLQPRGGGTVVAARNP